MVCKAAAAAGSESRGLLDQPTTCKTPSCTNAPMSVRLAVRTHLRREGCFDPSASKLQVGEDGRGEGGALQACPPWLEFLRYQIGMIGSVRMIGPVRMIDPVKMIGVVRMIGSVRMIGVVERIGSVRMICRGWR